MSEWFRFSTCYRHTFTAGGQEPFGVDTRAVLWDAADDAMASAYARQDAAFEFISKLRTPFYYCHDRDVAPEGDSVAASEANLARLIERAGDLQRETGIQLLWGTANLFGNPRSTHLERQAGASGEYYCGLDVWRELTAGPVSSDVVLQI